MSNYKWNNLIYRAYLRDGHTVHTGEALLIACLLHAHGNDRSGSDMTDIRRILKDPNFEAPNN